MSRGWVSFGGGGGVLPLDYYKFIRRGINDVIIIIVDVYFFAVEKAEHQGCCGLIPPESGRNRNPALDSGTPTNRNEIRNVQPRLAAARLCRPSPATVHSPLALVASHFLTLPQLSHGWLVVGCILRPPLSAAQFPHHLLVRSSTLLSPRLVFGFHPVWYIVLPDCSVFFLL